MNTKLEFDEDQLHTTFHDRNDGTMVATLTFEDTGNVFENDGIQAAARETAKEVCKRFNAHDALVDSLRNLVSSLEELNEGDPAAVELKELKSARKLLKRLYP